MSEEERAARCNAIYVRANERAATRWLTARAQRLVVRGTKQMIAQLRADQP